jgi:hypothetical protein
MAQVQPQRPDPDRSVRVAQACGMISAQADCSMDTAIALLEKRAALIGCAFADIATAVIDRRLRFDGSRDATTPSSGRLRGRGLDLG